MLKFCFGYLGGSGQPLGGTCESAELPVGARDSFQWRPVVQSFPYGRLKNPVFPLCLGVRSLPVHDPGLTKSPVEAGDQGACPSADPSSFMPS
jgi:hypothetical protein